MTTQYRSAGTTFHWPSLIYNAEQQQVGRTILRKSLLRLQCGAAKPTPLITYAIKSSRLPRAEENEKSSVDSAKAISGSRVFHQPNTVGIIGGASAPVTADFVKKVVEWSSGETEESLPLLLCSDPQLKQEFHSLLAGIDLGTSGKSVFPDHGGSVLAALMEKRTFLENSGACCIVMPCHVAHAWYPKLLQGCSVPFLHIGDCVARELKEANFRPIETGSNVKIGLLGTEETLNAGFYQDKLSNQFFVLQVVVVIRNLHSATRSRRGHLAAFSPSFIPPFIPAESLIEIFRGNKVKNGDVGSVKDVSLTVGEPLF